MCLVSVGLTSSHLYVFHRRANLGLFHTVAFKAHRFHPFLGDRCLEGRTRSAHDTRGAGEALQVQRASSFGPEQSGDGGEAPGGTGDGELRFHPGERHDGKFPTDTVNTSVHRTAAT